MVCGTPWLNLARWYFKPIFSNNYILKWEMMLTHHVEKSVSTYDDIF